MLDSPTLHALQAVAEAAAEELPHRTEKPWGYELLWAWSDRYAAKLLHVRSGQRLSLQYHRVKEETMFVIRGRLTVELEASSGEMESLTLLPGDVLHILPGRRHRLSAVEESDVLEVSTPELEDLVRLQDDFGRA